MAVPLAPLAPARAFTIHDLFEMPDDGFRYEVLDSALIVTSAPGVFHQYVGDGICQVLRRAAPPDVFAVTAIAVRLGEDTTSFIPDVVVTTVDPRTRPPSPDGKWAEAHEVPAVVEIVSPSSKRRDRFLKPEAYASGGIGCYWRVELDPEPTVFVHVLDGDAYRLVDTLRSGEVGTTEPPFPVSFDPGAL